MNHYKLLWYLLFISFHDYNDSFSDYKHRIRGSWPVPSSNPHLFDASLVTSKSVRRRRSLGARGKDILGTPPRHGAGCVKKSDCWDWWGCWGEPVIWFQIHPNLEVPEKISSNTFDSRNIVRQSKTSSMGCMSLWHFCCSFGAGTWQQATDHGPPCTFSPCEPFEMWQQHGTLHHQWPNETLFSAPYESQVQHMVNSATLMDNWRHLQPGTAKKSGICLDLHSIHFQQITWTSFCFGQTDPDSSANLPWWLPHHSSSFLWKVLSSHLRAAETEQTPGADRNFSVTSSSHPVLLPQQKTWSFNSFFSKWET